MWNGAVGAVSEEPCDTVVVRHPPKRTTTPAYERAADNISTTLPMDAIKVKAHRLQAACSNNDVDPYIKYKLLGAVEHAGDLLRLHSSVEWEQFYDEAAGVDSPESPTLIGLMLFEVLGPQTEHAVEIWCGLIYIIKRASHSLHVKPTPSSWYLTSSSLWARERR